MVTGSLVLLLSSHGDRFIGLTNLWVCAKTAAKDNARALYNDCLASTLMQATDRINHTLLPMVGEPANDYVVYDITIKTQGTLEERIAALQTACGGPFMSREEVRALIDLPREPDGDLIIPLNVLTGGLASSHDTDPTQERYNAAPVDVKADAAVLDDPKGDEPPVARKAKGDPSEDSVDELAGVYRAFFERQRNSVVPKIESGAANWWNAERWDRELADDLYPVAIAQADRAGEDAVRVLWPDDPSRKYGKKQTAAYISKMCLVRAQAVNAVTHRELADAIDDGGKAAGVDAKGLRSTIGGVFAHAILNRSRTTASALACALVGFATMEGVKQNKRRGENVYKTWRTTSGNPRSSHRAMNGEQVQYDEAFSNGMMWPGDWRNGSAAEVAFCKCVLDVEVRESSWERERVYGVPYEDAMVVPPELLESEELASKFDGISDDPEVDAMLLDGAKHALERNSGKKTESMTLVDIFTYDSVTVDCDIDYGIVYNDEMREFIAARKDGPARIAAVHNHPNGTPPSIDDLSKAAENNYSFGVVAGHNGQVYWYGNYGKIFKPKTCLEKSNEIAFYASGGIDVDRAFRMVYDPIGLKYEIR